MTRNRFIAAMLFSLFVIVSANVVRGGSDTPNVSRPDAPQRIVSMAPSITETLFAIGAGDKVVGVTRYCTYPPEAQTRQLVGGYIDPNYEVIVSLQPHLVVVYPYHDEAIARLATLRIPTAQADPRTIDGIHASIRELGQLTGREEAANALLDELEQRTAAVQSRVAGLPRLTVLISAGRSKGDGTVGTVYAAGRGQWYDTLIEIAGGTNAYDDEGIQFPSISVEGVYALDPDVIVEMMRNVADSDVGEEQVLSEWNTLTTLRAVQDGRVHVLGGDYSTIPGPRYVQVLEDLARALHPSAFEATP